ncbi:hypothetical protein PRIPAC_83952 [Pristionchus pacificus]|uniref:Uncharacterized protein n=1 Tax=Pristionchus pacificus TaxID=54126 RepID=A0A2A6BLL9_PRIPA|nr:hypothetical protein PRIPAC_83952 [Pristionchus pacificus]|eukprot:PDM66671.1 hypothetical protein PRIPAC_48088 [Pristionchus pacificus]
MPAENKDRRQSDNENRTPSEGGSESGKSDELKQAENVLAHTGLAAQTNIDYPEAAVKAYHNKPQPRNQIHNTMPHCNRASGPIQQPTKI